MFNRPEFAHVKHVLTGLALCALLSGCGNKPDTQATPSSGCAASADTPVLSVPLERNGHWVVDAQGADGKTHRVLLDTGATFNVLESQGPLAAAPLTPEAETGFLRQGVLGASIAGANLTVSTLSDPKEFALGLTPALRIQNWSMPAGVPALRGSLGRLASADDAPFEAIIGNERMRELTWRADYVAGRLTAYATNEAPAHEWQQCALMTLDARTRMPAIQINLDDTYNFFILDTGYDGDVMLPQDLFDNLVKENKFAHVGTSSSIDATDRVVQRQQGLLAGLAIGQKQLPRLAVSGAAPEPRIGLGLLEKMDRFELDFRHFRFCFDLPAKPMDSTLETHSALLRSGERYEVVALAPDGILAVSGAQLGDQITTIDQTSVANLDLAKVIDLLSAPTTREVTVLRGKRTLVIELKPAQIKPA